MPTVSLSLHDLQVSSRAMIIVEYTIDVRTKLEFFSFVTVSLIVTLGLVDHNQLFAIAVKLDSYEETESLAST